MRKNAPNTNQITTVIVRLCLPINACKDPSTGLARHGVAA